MKKQDGRRAGRSLLLCLMVFAVLTLARGEARADEVFFAGFTTACFGPANCTPGQTASYGGWTFQGGTFSGVTTNGRLSLNLGTLSVGAAPEMLSNNTSFRLFLTFTAPQSFSFGDTVNTFFGTTSITEQNFILLDMHSLPLVFTFNDTNCEPDPTGGLPGQSTTCGRGIFLLNVSDLAIRPGETLRLNGGVRDASQNPIPEPATLLLLGTGLSCVAAGARRRRKAAGR